MKFPESRLKIERAEKHISDMDSLLESFIHSNFYDLSIQRDDETGHNFLHPTINFGPPAEQYALIIGDALHNLRSALDLAYYESVILCGGVPTKWTRFPIADTRELLISTRLKPALEKKQITPLIYFMILEVIKSYQAGNPSLWTLDDWNITDKHQLLIPVLKLMIVKDVRFEDEKHRPLLNLRSKYLFGDSGDAWLMGADGMKNITVKDKGHATVDILLTRNILKKIESVIPTLRGFSEEVSKTIELFDFLFRDEKLFRSTHLP
jgi:hypothetical protein